MDYSRSLSKIYHDVSNAKHKFQDHCALPETEIKHNGRNSGRSGQLARCQRRSSYWDLNMHLLASLSFIRLDFALPSAEQPRGFLKLP